MNKVLLKKFLLEDNLLIIIDGFLIVLLLIGFLIFGLSDPTASYMQGIESRTELQESSEDAFLLRYNEGNFTPEEPYFILDPYDIAPLSGLIMFKTEEAVSLRLVVLGKEAEADIEFITPLTKNHFIPVYGLYPGYLNTVNLYTINGDTEELVSSLKIMTEYLPGGMITPTVMETTHDYFGSDFMLMMPALGGNPVAYDYLGDIRWYLSTSLSWAPVILENGNLLLGTDELMGAPYYSTGLYEIDFLGKIHTEYYLPGGYHHDVHEMSNGNFLIASNDFDGSLEDVIVEVNRVSGEIVNTWDIGDYISKLEGPSAMWLTYDWFQNNSIFYDEDTDSIILSGRNQDAVISLGYTSNIINWIIGDPTNWDQALVDEYFFTPTGDTFEWQYAQHSVMVLEDGNIFMFDNGNNRSKLRETDVDANDNYSRGVIYNIDPLNMTIEQVYQFGKELGSNFYSPYVSNVDYYADGHYLIHSGGHSSINGDVQNTAPPKPNLLTLVVPNDPTASITLNSTTIEVLDDTVVYRIELPGNFYQAKKISVYSSATTFYIGPARTLGSFAVTAESEDAIETRYNFLDTVPARINLSLLKENERLVIEGNFKETETIYVVLENSMRTYAYLIPTDGYSFTGMCTVTCEDDNNRLTFYINEEGINGTYNVYIYVNGHRYDTYKKVFFK